MALSQLQAQATLNTGMTNNSDLNAQTKEQLDQLEFKVAFQEDTIEIQGDCRDQVAIHLSAIGFKTKIDS